MNRLLDWRDKALIASFWVARFCLRLLWAIDVAVYLIAVSPAVLLIPPAEKIAQLCACPRCGSGRIASAFQGITDFIRKIYQPINAAEEWTDEKIGIWLLALRLRQAELRTRLACRWRQI